MCLFPQLCADWIIAHADAFGKGALVIDCAGVKRHVMGQVVPVAEGREWTYIGGHPMAGREFSGFAAARANLFENASMILCPPPEASIEAREAAKAFLEEQNDKIGRQQIKHERRGLDFGSVILGRALENALKLALIKFASDHACELPPEKILLQKISQDQLRWGYWIAATLAQKTINKLKTGLPESRFDKQRQRVFELIKQKVDSVADTDGNKVQGCTRRTLMQRAHCKTRELSEVLDSLLEAEEISVSYILTKGMRKKIPLYIPA